MNGGGGKSGAVGLTSKALEAIMLGRPETIGAVRLRALERYASGEAGTPNQRAMAAAAGLHLPYVTSLHAASVAQIDKMLTREEAEGPRPWEMLCPDPHEGMYLLARVGVIAAGGVLGARAAAILGQELRVADLVASPDGFVGGLPGMRAPHGARLSRRPLESAWKEVRRRQGVKVVHRGTGGRKQDLKWKMGTRGPGVGGLNGEPGSDPLILGPAWWLRLLLDAGDGARGRALLAEGGPLSRTAPLPARLRLGLTVARWRDRTLAWLEDPGEEHRAEFMVSGSAAAKRAGGKEKPTTWIRVEWVAPAKHRVTAGLAWETWPASTSEALGTGTITRIPGVSGVLA